MSQLRDKYQKEVMAALKERYGYQNIMQVPRLEKVVLNIGMGEAITNAKALEAAERDLATITGQHAVTTRARRSISAFRLRAGMPIGLKVTLRGQRMYDFVDKLVNAVLCRIRDFQGIPRDSFDGRGNYTMPVREQTVFPEIELEKVDRLRGLEITFVTTAKTDEEGRTLLELMGMPFSKE
ncbi:MAG: 50S ribosomal protein L5 [Chloroflexi bacterium]|nr:50S ribosomal protein L5 [Chloroflexota bacterium]